MVFRLTVVFGIDVSKDTSAIAENVDRVLVWQSKINNNWFGFQELLKRLQEYSEPQIVFEATGVYSKRLSRFLEENGYRYTMLNPLAAKKQLDGLRTRKTDKNDAVNLADTQFIFERRLTYYQKPVYRDLMDLSRFYEQINSDLVTEKNRLHKSLQMTFPELEGILDKPSGKLYWHIVATMPHPDLLNNMNVEELATQLKESGAHISVTRATIIAKKLFTLGQTSFPGSVVEAPDVDETRYHSEQVARLDAKKTEIIAKMVKLAKPLPEFEVLMSIPGFAEKTVVRLIGELGDIRRFGSSNKLNAFVGIDLRHYESGNFIATDHISKRGDHIARAILFRAIANIVSAGRYQPSRVNDYYREHKKKLPKVNGKAVGTKKVTVAAMGRLLRTIYHLVTNNEMFKYDV